LLLFGGDNLGEKLKNCGKRFKQKLIPNSEKRYLFITRN